MPLLPTNAADTGPMMDLEKARGLLAHGRVVESQALCEAVLSRHPSHPGARLLLGIACAGLKQFTAALRQFDALIQLDPRHGGAWLHRGMCLIGLDRFSDGAESLRQSVMLRPDDAMGRYCLGFAMICLGRFQDALIMLDRARSLSPSDAAIQTLYVTTLKWTRGTEEAMRQSEMVTATFPEFAPGWFGKSILHLLLGDYPKGWELHEWRLKLPNRTLRPEIDRLPRWSGQAVRRGATILFHNDSGLGDAIQFCRFVPIAAAAAGARVSLLVPSGLTRLMRSLEGIDRVLAGGVPLPEFDYQCPLMSLPFALGTTLDTIPRHVPYLYPSEAAVEAWRIRLGPVSGPRVGLVWAAAARPGENWSQAFSRRKSMTLATLGPLGAVPDVVFISLQVGAASAEAKSPPPGMVLRDLTDGIGDFEDTAAIIANLDLVVSVDTSVAHLAGAMGKPVWLMNPFDTCWRWMLDRHDSPWYPTLRIFRQPASGCWTCVVRDVAEALRNTLPARP